ncbi:DUF1642 domain-containing protein [Listeria monocytogenes]|uniref:DUF1642 domain-containing protein n=1 Tax=Listeria monocytogenes TaxID=1639 RepID=UPI000F25E664|nr:DUF1642 domain-containing protein [Listeria monocytogenes]EHP6530301.1 DUF1642 domain-containing protein [Listeria monocytogenes]MCX82972.1 DUF1642 domain-containing protein [Listeria monocytogenes]TYV90615.1 DUF1642 domain-containing protein [Listeria monocytogenes]
MIFREGDKVQFIANNELIIGTIKRVNNNVGWVDLKVSDSSWFFRKLEDVVKVKEPELIAVPRFAADWISQCKQREYDLTCLLDYDYSDMSSDISSWLRSKDSNQELLARAWMDGYEVEKEPLYYVKFIDHASAYLNVHYDNHKVVGSNGETSEYKTRFTEAEIKTMDNGEAYWLLRKPVEEVTE